MKSSIPTASALWLLILGLSTPGLAQPVQVTFSGAIDTIDDPTGLLPAGISIGTPFSGTYTFDATSPGAPSELLPGVFFYPFDPTASLSVDVGGNDFSVVFPFIAIANDYPTSEGLMDFWSSGFPAYYGIQPAVDFGDASLTQIVDPTLYFVNDSLDGWTESHLYLFDSDAPQPDLLASGPILLIGSPPVVPTLGPVSLVVVFITLLAFGVLLHRPRCEEIGCRG